MYSNVLKSDATNNIFFFLCKVTILIGVIYSRISWGKITSIN